MFLDIEKAEFLKPIIRVEQAPKPARPTVAFAGRSNVGKSSLLNTLLKKKGLARTSSTPGRTQEIIYFNVNDRYYFVDLPGYGYAKVPKRIKAKWGPMIENYLEQNEQLRLVVLIFDLRHGPTANDLTMIEWLEHAGVPYFFALTKADKLSVTKRRKQLILTRKKLGLADDAALLVFSAKTGMGRRDLLGVVFESLGAPARSEDGGTG